MALTLYDAIVALYQCWVYTRTSDCRP